MNTTIRAAAQAGHAARFAGRPGHRWEHEPNAVQIRWELVAARVLNGEIRTIRALRDAYQEGRFDVPDWADLSRREQWRWFVVLDAIQAAGAMEQAA